MRVSQDQRTVLFKQQKNDENVSQRVSSAAILALTARVKGQPALNQAGHSTIVSYLLKMGQTWKGEARYNARMQCTVVMELL